MALKTGYKHTEVGVIPEDWTLTTVRDFAKIITGPFGTLLKASEYSESNGVPLISVGEIREGYLNITHETPRVSSEVTRRLPQYVLKQGDIIFGRKGGVDRSALIRQNHAGWFLGSDGIALRPFGRLCHEYAALQFQSKRVQSWLLQHAIGTTMPSLNQTILSNVLIPVPATLHEQEAIAGALSDADAWIESLEQLIAKKRQIKQGAMQELLTGKRRLPGFSGKWETKRLGDLGSTYGGLTGKTKTDFGAGGAMYVTFMNVMSNVVIDCTTFERVNVVASESQNRVVKNDILFNGSSETPEEVAMCALVDTDVTDVYLNSFCFGFRFREDVTVDGRFLAYYLRSNVGREIMKSLAQGSTRYNLSKTALLKAVLQLPSPHEQTAIATVLSDMDNEIESLEQTLAKAREIKQGMMQELLTGKIRLVKSSPVSANPQELSHDR